LYNGTFARGWQAGGTEIASSSTRQRLNSILQDGKGGFYSVNDYDLMTHTYCHRVTTYGYPAIGWPADGLVISSVPSFGATAALDGQGGLFFFWSSFSASGDPSAGIYALRLTPEGSPAPGWPAEGLRVSSIESNEPLVSVATSDGGAIVSWFHFDSGVVSAHAQKVSPTGAAPGWPENGVLLAQGDRYIQNIAGAPDGLGGVYLAWEFYENAPPGVPPATGVVAQHLTSDGSLAQGWPMAGLPISASAFQGNNPAMIPVTGNAALVAWEGYFNGPANKIMAQKLIGSGLESFSIVLAHSDVAPNRVHLQWRATPSADVPVRVYRRAENEDWQLQDAIQPDLTGILVFNDLTAVAGNSYSYRLSVTTGEEKHFYGEIRIQVPAFALALRVASANPVRGDLSADLDLPSSGTARVELLDVRGRLVATKEARVSGSTTLRLPIASGRGLASGVYFVRLTMGGKTVTRRAVMLH